MGRIWHSSVDCEIKSINIGDELYYSCRLPDVITCKVVSVYSGLFGRVKVFVNCVDSYGHKFLAYGHLNDFCTSREDAIKDMKFFADKHPTKRASLFDQNIFDQLLSEITEFQ